jgi:hypothetical protein
MWSEDKRGKLEEKTALKWRKPTYVIAYHLDIGESPPRPLYRGLLVINYACLAKETTQLNNLPQLFHSD